MTIQILLLLINFVQGVDNFYECQISTTGQINQKGDYQFKIIRSGDPINHPINLFRTYFIQIDFPWNINNDYTCYDESSSLVVCNYVANTRVIVNNYFVKDYSSLDYIDSEGFTFLIDLKSILNPSYSGTYDNPIQISIMSSTNGILEQCPNGGVHPIVSPGTGTCSGDGQQSKVNSINTDISLNMFVKNSLAVESYLIVKYTRFWSNDKITKEMIPGAISCQVYANQIFISGTTCTKDSTNLQIKSNLGTGYSGTNITLVINGVNSPSSTTPDGSFILQTYNSNNKLIDECSISSISGWTPNVVILSSMTWTNLVNQVERLNVQFQLNTQILVGDTIQITIPKELKISSTILTQIRDTKSTFFNTPLQSSAFTINDQLVTITSSKAFSSTLTNILLTFFNVAAPPSIKPSSTIQISTYRGSYVIDKSTASLTITASNGAIRSVSIVALNKIINQLSDYEFDIGLTNPILSDGYLKIQFPTQFDLTQITKIQNYLMNTQSYDAKYSVSGQSLILTSLYSSDISASAQIKFQISQIKNQFSANISNTFTIQSYYSKNTEDFLVDQHTTYQMSSFTSGTLDTSSISVKAEFYITGQIDNYEISLVNKNAITSLGYFIVSFISEFSMSGNPTSCLVNEISSSCSTTAKNTIKIVTSSSISSSTNIKLKINSYIYNPVTLQSLNNILEIKTYDDQGLLIDSGQGGTIQMLSLSTFSLTLSQRASQMNGVKNTYTFNINFEVTQINGVYLIIEIPNDLSDDLQSCQSISPLSSTLPCSISNQKLQIQLVCNTCTSVTKNIDYKITINQIINHFSFKPVTISIAYTIQDLSNDLTKQSQLKDQLIITNTQTNTIKSFTQSYEYGYLNQLDNYLFNIEVNNQLRGNFKIVLNVPAAIKVYQSTDSTPTSISNIQFLPNDASIIFNSQSIIITGYSGSQISSFSFKVINLLNPSTSSISTYFTINTYYIQSTDEYQMDASQLGTYNHKCTLPCKDCDSVILTKCSSCYDNSRSNLVQSKIYFMSIQNTCIIDCYSIDGYFVTSGEYTCQKCNPECKKCKDLNSYCLECSLSYKFLNNKCLESCPKTYFNNQQVCTNCINNCDTCSNTTDCQVCSVNFYLYQQQCIEVCPANITIANLQQQTCDVCTNNCQTCQNQTSYCITCKTNYYLSNNTCISLCKDGTYPNGSQCTDCLKKCKTCSNGTNCDTCANNLLFHQNDCLDKCPDQYFANSGKCSQCNIQCNTCENNQYRCTSCLNNSFLYNNQCLGQCPEEYYNDIDTNKCIQCKSPCKTCKSSTSCLSCITQTPVLYYYNNSCHTDCLQYYAPEKGQCVQCRNPCKQCTTTPDICNECYPNTYLLNQMCVTDCGEGYYKDSQNYQCQFCSDPCKSCSNKNNNCLSCKDNLYLFKNTCVENCQNGYYQQDQQCQPCLNVCLSCLDNVSCTQCKENLILYNNQCLTSCPQNLFEENNSCVGCRSPCLQCGQSPNDCLSCVSTTFLNGQSECVKECEEGYYGDQISNKCLQCVIPCKKCSSSTSCLSCIDQIPILFYYNNSCNTICPKNQVPENGVCVDCRQPCKTCNTTPDDCISCLNDSYLHGNKCLSVCDDGYYADNTINECKQCISPCQKCLSLTTCITCLQNQINKILVDGTCISSCPTGYYESKGTCLLCTIDSKDKVCNSTVQVLESIQTEKFIPMPCTILTLVFTTTVIVAKITKPETFIPGAVTSIGGLFEWGSHCVLLYLSYSQWGLFNTKNYIIMGALAFNYLFNFIHLISARFTIYNDAYFQQWLSSRQVNKITYAMLSFIGFITTFKINKLYFSRYFGFYFFKACIVDINKFLFFNIISLLSIFLTTLPMIVASAIILNEYDQKDQLYISTIDSIIVTFIIFISIIWESQKNEDYFKENGLQALNYVVAQSFIAGQSEQQPVDQSVEQEEVNLNEEIQKQQIEQFQKIHSTNNQKKSFLLKNNSDIINPGKKHTVVPEDGPFFRTQNSDSYTSQQKKEFDQFIHNKNTKKNPDDQSLNLSSIQEQPQHPLNETSQDKDFFNDYKVLQFQNPEELQQKFMQTESQQDFDLSSELEGNNFNFQTNQLNTPQNITAKGTKFKKRNKTIEIVVDEMNYDKNDSNQIQNSPDQKKQQENNEEEFLKQKLEEERLKIIKEEELKLEQLKEEQRLKEELYQEQLLQIQLEKQRIENEKKQIEEAERIKAEKIIKETQRREKEILLENEEKQKLWASQLEEEQRQRVIQEQREFELKQELEKEKLEKIKFQQQLQEKLIREQELEKLEIEKKKKAEMERLELQKLEEIRLEELKIYKQKELELQKQLQEQIKKEKEEYELRKIQEEETLKLQGELLKRQQQEELRLKQEEEIRQQQVLQLKLQKEEELRKQQEEEENQKQLKLLQEEEQKQLRLLLEEEEQKKLKLFQEEEQKRLKLLQEEEELQRLKLLEQEEQKIFNSSAQRNQSLQFIDFDNDQDQISQDKEANKNKKQIFLQLDDLDDQFVPQKKSKFDSASIELAEEKIIQENDQSGCQNTDYLRQFDINDPKDIFQPRISSKSISVNHTHNNPQQINKTIQDYPNSRHFSGVNQHQFIPKKKNSNVPITNYQKQEIPKRSSKSSNPHNTLNQQSQNKVLGTPTNYQQNNINFIGNAYNTFAPKTVINKEKDDRYLRQKEEIYLQHIPNYYEKQVLEDLKKKKQYQQQKKNARSSQHKQFEVADDLHLDF
ncbi:unnamed protein product [Paramecium sonneborni]|uniref:EGF-like domain-containing protein n=1 Tax=Paramecium sonneborni TaxID=65129 RepID=A0A8S1RIX6_9CILI|nr:unnamed protein product [Paramecium sonneborni]